MKDICKEQIKPRMNPTVIERKWCLQKETKQQSKAAKETVRLASLTDDTSWHGSFQVRKHSGEQDRPGTHPHDPKPLLSTQNHSCHQTSLLFHCLALNRLIQRLQYNQKKAKCSLGALLLCQLDEKTKHDWSRICKPTKTGEVIPESQKYMLLISFFLEWS